VHKSTITSKYQVTVPKAIRERLGLSVSDQLHWELRGSEVVITVATPAFLERRGSIVDGPEAVDAVHQMRRSRGRA